MILVFGKSGQVACELQAIIADARFLSRDDADLSDPQACAEHILSTRPDAVINAAAYTAVDKAEDDEDRAMIVNGDAPTAMAEACATLGIPIVHISTDYVFDGNGDTPFPPDYPVEPLGAYGRTKLAGEKGIQASGAAFAVLRTSWVFSSFGGNFVKTMLRLAETRESLNVVADQIGGPTSARSIARACATMARQLIATPQKSGIYHFSGSPDVSWADFARAIFETAGKNVRVNDIPTSDYPTPAARPLNSRLDCSSLNVFGLSRPDWKPELEDVIAKLEVRT
ncbi:dTDP-4-dehydrorhamnose reductase [Martelella radicis]|uniref:dTDP-4-dehydrorhamnose reductase n=1 Tax=Martelella radicis TaxID=1397476 RepID=A0A7W6PAS4_9HYPH|nr:dTDP-4-dehydrorhamnose reductase [Martelella radicis]MBB4122681.1 dTDP-4-dehydrorhamnose reductase [Martelella radicis]